MTVQEDQPEVPLASLVEEGGGVSDSAEIECRVANPYADPVVESREKPRLLGPRSATCPFCQNNIAESVTFTIWGGFFLTRMFSCVRCLNCLSQYNGKTGATMTFGVILGIGIRILLLLSVLAVSLLA